MKCAREIERLFHDKGFDPADLPKGEFDPAAADPLVYAIAWCSVREDVEAALEQQLGLDSRSSLHLILVSRRVGGRKRARLAFFKQPEPVRQVLRRAMDLPDSFFVDVAQVLETISFKEPVFLPRFRATGGGLDLGEVETALLALIQNDETPVRRLNLSATPHRRPDKLRITSNWNRALAGGAARDYYWRLNVGIERNLQFANTWDLITRLDIGWRSRSMTDAQMRWIGDTDTLSDLRDSLTVGGRTAPSVSRLIVRSTPPHFVSRDPTVESVEDPSHASSLAATARMVFGECQIKLLGRRIE